MPKIRENIIDTKKLLINSINNFTFFIITFLIAYTIYQLSTVLIASSNGTKTILFYHTIQYPMGLYTHLWDYQTILSTFMAGPVITVFLSFVFWILFRRYKNRGGIIKMFFFWGMVNSSNMLLGSMISGIISDSGFGNLINWLYVDLFGKILIVFFLIGLLVFIGVISVRSYLESSNSTYLIDEENRHLYFISGLLIPWFFGSILLIAIQIPEITLYNIIPFLTMLVLIIPALARNKAVYLIELPERRKRPVISLCYIMVMFAFLLIFRIGLMEGISFG